MVLNLRSLFKEEYDQSHNAYRSIYQIYNNINGKSYVGQAKDLFSRFIYSGFSHKTRYVEACISGDVSNYLYNSIRKYGSRNFSVIILEDNVVNLNEKEIFYIKELHTCRFDELCNGYNMTWGGEDASQMHTEEVRSRAVATTRITSAAKYGAAYGWLFTPESIAARIESDKRNHGGVMAINSAESVEKRTASNRANHGGVLSINTESAIEKSHQSLMQKYGSAAGKLLDPEVRAKALESQLNNHGGKLACNTAESVERSVATQKRNNDGKLAFNTAKSYDTNRSNHGGRLSMHTDEGIHNSRLGKWFVFSNKYLSDLPEITALNYCNRATAGHLIFLRDNLMAIRSDSRLSAELKPLLDDIISITSTTIP